MRGFGTVQFGLSPDKVGGGPSLARWVIWTHSRACDALRGAGCRCGSLQMWRKPRQRSCRRSALPGCSVLRARCLSLGPLACARGPAASSYTVWMRTCCSCWQAWSRANSRRVLWYLSQSLCIPCLFCSAHNHRNKSNQSVPFLLKKQQKVIMSTLEIKGLSLCWERNTNVFSLNVNALLQVESF